MKYGSGTTLIIGTIYIVGGVLAGSEAIGLTLLSFGILISVIGASLSHNGE